MYNVYAMCRQISSFHEKKIGILQYCFKTRCFKLTKYSLFNRSARKNKNKNSFGQTHRERSLWSNVSTTKSYASIFYKNILIEYSYVRECDKWSLNLGENILKSYFEIVFYFPALKLLGLMGFESRNSKIEKTHLKVTAGR